jgi:hypothetical protein
MKFNDVKFDAPIVEEHWADYWRERAECLEEWVCELLRKNQALRMALQQEPSHPHRGPKTTPPFLFPNHDQAPIPTDGPAHRRESPSLAFDDSNESCPRKECIEIRKSVIQYALINNFAPEASN